MNDANTVTYDTTSQPRTFPAKAVRPAAGLPNRLGIRDYSLPVTCRPASPHFDPAAGWEVREDGEDFIADLLSDSGDESDAELAAAADAHTEGLRAAMSLLDEAANLLAVLMASVEDVGDSRAMQAETVLKIVEKKLNKAHTRIDRQETRQRKLFLAHAELQARAEKSAE